MGLKQERQISKVIKHKKIHNNGQKNKKHLREQDLNTHGKLILI